VSPFTSARRGACYPVGAGDFSGPVIDAAGTRYFEPDGVVFCDLAPPLRCYQPPTVSRAVGHPGPPWEGEHACNASGPSSTKRAGVIDAKRMAAPANSWRSTAADRKHKSGTCVKFTPADAGIFA
jgi:hypothetical protein